VRTTTGSALDYCLLSSVSQGQARLACMPSAIPGRLIPDMECEMDIRILTTSCQRGRGAMFHKSLGDTGLAFLYPIAASRLFHTFFCPPLRLMALSEEGEIIFNQVIAAQRFVRLPPTRLVLETDPAAALPPLGDLRALLERSTGVPSAAWDEYTSPDRLLDRVLEQAVADMRRAYEAHQRSGPVRPEVLRARFAPWERGDLCTAAIMILDRAAIDSIPHSAVSFSYQILQVERPHLEELAAASLAGQPWRMDFPQECLRCGKAASWRRALTPPPELSVELTWRYERPENAVPLCKHCAYRLGWSKRDGLRIDLAWGLWGPRFESFWMWHSAPEQGAFPRDWDRETHPLWPPQFGGDGWETGSGAKEHAEPRPPQGVARAQVHQAALARALGVRLDARPRRDTLPQFLLKYG
jgi:hypothetical protein